MSNQHTGANQHTGPRATLQDVADLAGVSLTTASRVLSEGSARRVRPDMASRVSQAAVELGYLANLQARAVATGRSSTVGIVVRDIADPYFSSIVSGFVAVADERGLLVCIASTSGEAGERAYVSLMRAQRARAVVLVGSRFDDQRSRAALAAEIGAFTGSGGRVVCVGQDLLGVDTIVPANAAGAEVLGRSLVALGHRSFAVLAGPRGLLTASDRVAGFSAGLRAWSVELDPRLVVHGEFTRDGGYEAMSGLLAGGARPDCVFAVNDVMAVGALARLRADGISVPAEMAVAGFDDILTLRDVYPPLTTVALPLRRMGEMAANLVLADPAHDQPRTVPVPGEVILRDSTLPRPPNPPRQPDPPLPPAVLPG